MRGDRNANTANHDADDQKIYGGHTKVPIGAIHSDNKLFLSRDACNAQHQTPNDDPIKSLFGKKTSYPLRMTLKLNPAAHPLSQELLPEGHGRRAPAVFPGHALLTNAS